MEAVPEEQEERESCGKTSTRVEEGEQRDRAFAGKREHEQARIAKFQEPQPHTEFVCSQ